MDIEYWGLAQPGAPSPQAAGWVLMELLDLEVDFQAKTFKDFVQQIQQLPLTWE